MTTINGKSVQEIEEALKAPFTGLVSCRNNNPEYAYIDFCYYKERLDKVLGSFHYSETYSELSHIRCEMTGQELVSCACTITIHDDNGSAVIKRQAFGGVELQKESKSGKIKAISNELIIANRIAFRNTCTILNLFEYGGAEIAAKEGRIAKSNNNKSKGTPSGNEQSNNTQSNNTEGNILSGTFVSTAVPTTDTYKGNPFHKVRVKHLENNVPGDTEYELNIFSNNITPEVQNFINTSSGGKACTLFIRTAKLSIREGKKYPQLNISKL